MEIANKSYNAPLNIDISECQTQHENIQLLGLRRESKKHSNDIVNSLLRYQLKSSLPKLRCSYPAKELTGSVSIIILFGAISSVIDRRPKEECW
jgi:hypothetical protein